MCVAFKEHYYSDSILVQCILGQGIAMCVAFQGFAKCGGDEPLGVF